MKLFKFTLCCDNSIPSTKAHSAIDSLHQLDVSGIKGSSNTALEVITN